MLRKSLVPSVLLLTITAISMLTSATQAQEVKVPFKGSVVKACEFGEKVQTGILTGNDAVYPTQLSSKNEKGSAGSIVIKCNTEAVVSAKDYYPTANKFEVAEAVYTVSADGSEGPEVKVKNGVTEIGVNLTLHSKTAIPAGDYAYDVLVSAVAGN
jgi:hypothetical protein